MIREFNKIVITVATVILIIMLVLLGIFLSKSLMEDSYPPVISDCPDYWDISLNSDGNKTCVDVMGINSGIGTQECNSELVSLFNIGSNNDEINCNKYKWSKKCKVTWDGITNNSKPCENSIFF